MAQNLASFLANDERRINRCRTPHWKEGREECGERQSAHRRDGRTTSDSIEAKHHMAQNGDTTAGRQ